MSLFTMAGLGGVAAYVLAYALLQLGKLDGNGMTYSVLNVLAASLVLVSLTKDFNLASAITQITWIMIGIGGIGLRSIRRRDDVPIAPAGVQPPRRETHRQPAHVDPVSRHTRIITGLQADIAPPVNDAQPLELEPRAIAS